MNLNGATVKSNGLVLKSHFKHETDIHVFLTGTVYEVYRKFNRRLFSHLNDPELKENVSGDFWEPLNFFNFFYGQVDVIVRCHDRPLDVLEHLRALDLTNKERLTLLFFLVDFRGFAAYDPEEGDFFELMDDCFSFISEEYEQMALAMSGTPREYEASFEFTKAITALIPVQLRVQYLIDCITDCKQKILNRPESFSEANVNVYLQQCELEIERIERLQEANIYNKEVMKRKPRHTEEKEEERASRIKQMIIKEGLEDDFIFPERAYALKRKLHKLEQQNKPVPDQVSERPSENRLRYNYTPEQVEAYFMQLADHGFYTQEQVKQFLKRTFTDFLMGGEDEPEKVKLSIMQGLKQGFVRRLVYDFWFHGAQQFSQDVYVKMLLDNFAVFDNTTQSTLLKSFSRPAPKNYPFSCKILC